MRDTKNKRSRFLAVFLVLCWIMIISLAKDFGRVRAGFKRIDEAGEKLAQEQEKNSILKKKMVYAQSEYYKEKIVREKLNMQRPGEVVVVLPEGVRGARDTDSLEAGENNDFEMQNWEKWWELVRN